MVMSGVSVTYGIMAPWPPTQKPARSGAPARGRWRHDRAADLDPDRRRLAVRHPGRRRQGQGPEGPGGERHRLRGRRARLPHPRAHRGGRRGGLPGPQEPPVHADRRPARAAGGHRRQDPARLGSRGRRRRRSWSPTGASRPSPTRSPRCATPGDEVLVPAPYWTTYPEAIALAGGVPVVVPTDEPPAGSGSPSSSSRRPTRPRTKVLLFVSPSNPTGAVYPQGGDRGHRAVGGGARPVGGHRRDLRAPGLRRAPSSTRCRCSSPSWPTGASWSTAWPRPTP